MLDIAVPAPTHLLFTPYKLGDSADAIVAL